MSGRIRGKPPVRMCVLRPISSCFKRAGAAIIIGVGLFSFFSESSFAQSLTVSVSGTQVNWNTANGNSLNPGSATNPGSNTVSVTTTWTDLKTSGPDNLALYSYFLSSTAALAHQSICIVGCQDIPSSAIELRINGGALLPINQTSLFGVPGASRRLFTVDLAGGNKTGTRTDSLSFNINLSSLPNLPADSYSGTLFIQAQGTI